MSANDRRLRPCDNRACDRQTTALFCCGECAIAEDGGYDPDGYHSETCNQRHATRGPYQTASGYPSPPENVETPT